MLSMCLEVLSSRFCNYEIYNYKFYFILDNLRINYIHWIVITSDVLLLFTLENTPSESDGLELDKLCFKFPVGSLRTLGAWPD